MGEFSIWHILIVGVAVIVLFGRGKVSNIMGEFGRGISAFKKGIRDTNDEAALPPAEPREAQAAQTTRNEG